MSLTIRGQVITVPSLRPLADLRVEAWDRERCITERLGAATTDATGAFELAVEGRHERELALRHPDVYFRVLRGDRVIADTRTQVVWNVRDPRVKVVIGIADGHAPPPPPTPSSVSGRITTTAGVAVADVRVQAWDQTLAGPTLLATAVTDATGAYAAHYDPSELAGKPRADLYVRVLDPRRKLAEIARSAVIYQAPAAVTVNLAIAPAAVSRPSEYQRLLDVTAPLLGQAALAGLDPGGVVYLAGRSAWDARTIAMAAQADTLSAQTKIPAAHYYALLRAGQPGDRNALALLPDSAVRSAIQQAIDAGVIDAGPSINTTIELHRHEAVRALQTYTTPVSLSSLGDMLAVSLDKPQTTAFLAAYHDTADQPEALWSTLATAGFSAATIAKLQADGRLGFLTRQNAPLVARLQAGNVATDTDLARAGLYQADAWLPLIGKDVPAGLDAGSYAAGLAAQVQLGYPTLVLAELVRRGNLPIDQSTADADGEVAGFLRAGQGTYTIGDHPVKTWASYDKLSSPAKDAARLVERLYQLTPSNDAMVALHAAGVQSAFQIATMPKQLFLDQIGRQLPDPSEAPLVYQKALEIHTTALNVATAYLSYRTQPGVYALAGAAPKPSLAARLTGAADDPAPAPSVPGSATLDVLLGSMDYCACDECKSVLGAAAYFVDLLDFIDVAPVAPNQNPKDVLFGRRPDLQSLQLSCENTNIAMPYIDLVNEILEYWTIHGNLTAFAGFNMNTGDQTADLLADPVHVADAAYDRTKAEVYPFTLPFDMPLEALRLLMQAWSTTLADALRVFGTPLAARLEVLDLNAGETRILTDMSYRTLSEYFGEPAAESIDALNAAISNAKTFCTRTGIQYQDLVDLLGTTFINPGAPLVSLLTALQVSFSQLAAWYDHTLTDAQLAALLPPTLVIADYGGDVTAWLTANRALVMGLITLTETTADPSAGCSFANLQLLYTQPTDNALDDLAYWKLHRFIRLWKKLGWTIALTDQIVTTFLGIAPAALTDANLDATFTRLLARLAAFRTVIRRQAVPADRIADWLAVWDATQPIGVRRELLAHLVRIGTTDLDHLIDLTGIDPLADDLDADAPSILGLLDAWAALKATGLKVVDVDYLLRSRDAAGAIAPTQDALFRDLAALRDGLTAIEVDLAAPPDNADLGYVAGKLALVYDAAVVNDFIGLFAGTTTYSAPFDTVEEALPGPLVAADGKLAYDPFAKQLSHAGALSAATATALGAAADALTLADLSEITTAGDLLAYVAAFKVAVAALVAAGAADLAGLAADYPELAAVYDAVAPIRDPAAQATALVAQILPALSGRLKTLALGTTLASQLKTDQLLVDALTSGPAVLHASGDPARPILDDLRGLETPVALSANGGFALHLEPPSSDDYILYVAAPPGTTVTLTVAGAGAIPVQLVGVTGEVATAGVIALDVGTLTAAELTIDTLPARGSVELRWRTKGMAKAAIPASRIYADAALATASASLVRLHKAAMLLRAIPLTPAELAHLAAVNADTAGYLNALDVGGAIAAADLHAQWVRFAWLAWFGALHDSEPSDDTWVGLLANPLQVTPQGASMLAGAAGWAAQDLTDTLAHFGLVLPAPLPLGVFRKVKDAVDFVTASTQTAANLIAWTTATPDGPLITAIKDALRAGQGSTTWHTTLQSVNDALRNQRRDALVSYILHHAAPVSPIDTIDTADKLYEYFLIDVEMDACMQTSRIRLALSTVQLFAMRCLMNLEPEVSPQSIDAAQWQWMKRYRVWEANREIFLYPENWLVPELRDDKSSMFSELEAELVKVDITNDLAEDAYLAYLKKLDEIARLELVGSFLQEDPSNADDDVLHLFGRTNGNTHEYYYRRFEGNVWSPWSKMTLHIDGDLLFPVIWKTQLFVFWVSPVHKATGAADGKPQDQGNANWGKNALVSADINIAWGEYYQGKWTSPKSTDLNAPLTLTGMTVFEPQKLVLSARTETPSPEVSERLIMSVRYMGSPGAAFTLTFTSKNVPPIVQQTDDLDLFLGIEYFNYLQFWDPASSSQLASDALREPGTNLIVRVAQPTGALAPTRDERLLVKQAPLGNGFRLRTLMHPIGNQFEAPIYYDDDHATFVLTPAERVIYVPNYHGYYYNDNPVIVHIPPVYEQPQIPDPAGPIENPLGTVINPGYTNVIADNRAFTYGGATFTAGGIQAAIAEETP